VCDRIAILHQGELKELGRVDALLKVREVTEILATGLSPAACEEIQEVIRRHNGQVVSVGNPTATLEELFVKIIRESEAHPGRRVRGHHEPAAPSEGPVSESGQPARKTPET
jgi:ABC-2 type transport system ATP-binding protein